MKNWDDKFKIKEYCYSCWEEHFFNNEKGIFHYQLAYEAFEEDTQEEIKNFWGNVKEVKTIKGKWVNYKCPKCKKIVSFILNEQSNKWVRTNKS